MVGSGNGAAEVADCLKPHRHRRGLPLVLFGRCGVCSGGRDVALEECVELADQCLALEVEAWLLLEQVVGQPTATAYDLLEQIINCNILGSLLHYYMSGQ